MAAQGNTTANWSEIVLERLDAGIARVWLDRPDRRNALTSETMHRLHEVLAEIGGDRTLRAVIFTGRGRAFCAGLDLAVEGGRSVGVDRSPGEWMALQELFAGAVRRLRQMDKVVIAAVNGAAVGAGMALALGADLRIAAESATFHVGAVRIGLTAGECGISYHLPRCIGATRAFEIMLSGRAVDAGEALAVGLVTETVADAQLQARALALAADVLRHSAYAVSHTKQVMWANLDAPSLDAAIALENHAQVLALMTKDFNEAVTAFLEKRPAVFHNQ
ncbi:enoyl-CoA hydratase-related protein [uncultured Pseudacidovorax sp.]|uniref:enoyl-CoA hydratase/isomerase family protein n=1 Tax=uncultured Pseudacidovorax sp. TaxID=679313 RepID=UPI0025D18446|nr:enoyl-CoA hydratase-related protein [uncultured Pseudacidovorax sp.]